MNGNNYLLAVDASIKLEAVALNAVNLDAVVNEETERRLRWGQTNLTGKHYLNPAAAK